MFNHSRFDTGLRIRGYREPQHLFIKKQKATKEGGNHLIKEEETEKTWSTEQVGTRIAYEGETALGEQTVGGRGVFGVPGDAPAVLYALPPSLF